MSNELQTLWQNQPTDSLSQREPGEGRGEGPDLAVPTTQFLEPKKRQSSIVLWAALAAVAALAIAFVWRLNRLEYVKPTRSDAMRAVMSTKERVEDLLAECRTYSSPEAGTPDWKIAEAACTEVLSIVPKQPEATKLLTRIATLRNCETTYNSALTAESAGQIDIAVDAYSRVTKECEVYLVRAEARAMILLPEALALATSNCGATPCERLAQLECQRGSLENNPRFGRFLATNPGWQCPEWLAFRAPRSLSEKSDQKSRELRSRFSDTLLADAVAGYFDGNIEGARATLAAVLRDPTRAAAHDLARAMDADMQLITRLLLQISWELKKNSTPHWSRLEQDGVAALEADARIVLGDDAKTLSADEQRRKLKEFESFVRRNVITEVSRAAYEAGKALADRKDFQRACVAWKTGATFSRSDLDLLKALTNVCTKKAAAAFESASGCASLERALDFAVDGDGYREKINAELERLGCDAL